MCQEQCTTTEYRKLLMSLSSQQGWLLDQYSHQPIESQISSFANVVLFKRMRSPYHFLVFFILASISYACPTHPDDTALAKRNPAPLALDTSKAVPFPFPENQAPVLEFALSAIDSILDTVRDEGEDVVREWLKNANNDGIVSRSVIEERQEWIAIAKW